MTVHDDLLALTNQERQEARVGLLGVHGTLQRAAQGHAQWMAANRRMSHTGEGRSDFMDRVRAAGTYPSGNAGENIAMGYGTPAACINAWMKSTGHRRNMLNSSYRSVGFGAAKASNGDWYWCGVYGAAAPSDSPPAPPPTPPPPPPPRKTLWERILSWFSSSDEDQAGSFGIGVPAHSEFLDDE
jgi:hypothetical protein